MTQLSINFQPDQVFPLTFRQAEIAVDCLKAACSKHSGDSDKTETILPYLLHTVVLFFVTRDQLAFQAAFHHPDFEALTATKPIRQLPAYAQLLAVLASLKAPEGLVASLSGFSDTALGVVSLKAFRDRVVQHGVPSETSGTDYEALAQEAIAGWKRLMAAVPATYS